MNQKITFLELVELMARRQGCSKREADAFLREFSALVAEVVSSGEPLSIAGLGTFKPVWVEARASVNVQTGEPYVIPGHYKLSFTPTKSVREAVNEPFSCFCVEILPDDAAVDEPLEQEAGRTESDDGFADPYEAEEQEADLVADDDVAEMPAMPDSTADEDKLNPEEAAAADAEQGNLTESSTDDVAETSDEDSDGLPAVPVGPPADSQPADKGDEKADERDRTMASTEDEEEHSHIHAIHYGNLRAMRKREWRNGFWTGIFVAATIVGIALLCLYVVMFARQDTEYRRSVVPADSVKVVLPVPVDTLKRDSMPAEIRNAVHPQPAVTDTVRRGVFLTTLSLKHYGHKAFWVYIYQENKKIIKNPDNVPAGTAVAIPPAEKYGIDATDTCAINKALSIAAAQEWKK